MPFIEVNGAGLFYQLYGNDRPGKIPILLIHGSTLTGQANWGVVAPLLARHRRVIVPDCRGHGQSANPTHSYNFKEMAADMAALVRALGYTRAHVIGHSNGGNVALVFLLEHPEVVQTAVLQAANAYVSPDLIEKEPPIFDPERVAREAPAWMNSMIDLHGPTHGQDYWRDLLQMTLHETISEPNYTPADLAGVERPTLVIQGENDRVNAPARHAQFIARHIPFAELWLPLGICHNVHDEALPAWVERIEGFLERRGDAANESLYRLGRQRYPDQRLAVFDLRAAPATPGTIALSGKVLTADQRPLAAEALAPAQVDAAQVQVLLDDDTPCALINRPVTDLRREPGRLSERLSQGLLGEAVRVLERREEWSWVRMEYDDYLGWMQAAALHFCSRQEVEAYQAACQVQVVAELLPANWAPAPADDLAPPPFDRAGKLPFGLRLLVERYENDLAMLRLPDGRRWWVEAAGLLPLEERPMPDPAGIAFTLEMLQRFIGVPYLWGGRTPFGYDCSGLAQACWGFMGVVLPRDADQQYQAGLPVDGKPQPGDLLFFGDQHEDRPSLRHASISHVAISLGGDEVIHATGAVWGVTYNSLDPASPIYRAWLRDNLVGVRRYA